MTERKRPNLVQAGQVSVLYSEAEFQYRYGIIIACDNADQVRDALTSGKIEFDVMNRNGVRHDEFEWHGDE